VGSTFSGIFSLNHFCQASEIAAPPSFLFYMGGARILVLQNVLGSITSDEFGGIRDAADAKPGNMKRRYEYDLLSYGFLAVWSTTCMTKCSDRDIALGWIICNMH
jgi:hypothetical protein